ncbi:MAG: cupin domain-containing protein, partial [Actinomycetota bacterium]|nr:cupin domain-containing protein [Actinomycetota bacterium]
MSSKTGRALARAVAPLSAEQFLAEHWERKPYVATRRELGHFDDLLSEEDVERLVCSTGIRYPAFRLVKEGAKLDVADYTEDVPWRPSPFTGTANVERVLAEFEAGATIVLQGLHLHWPPLAAFCRDLEAELGEPVQANAYYTPRGSQGLPVHHDTHDVLSLQVAGEKRWLVYEPAVELPLKDQRYRPELGDPGEPIHDVTLGPGDTLYLPRGWLHEARTSGTDSLHITVGVNVYTRLDAFRAAIDDCADDVEFRRAVGDEALREGDLLDRLRERLSSEDIARRRRARFVKTRRAILEGQLRQLRRLDDLTAETSVERRPTVIVDVSAGNGRVSLAFQG